MRAHTLNFMLAGSNNGDIRDRENVTSFNLRYSPKSEEVSKSSIVWKAIVHRGNFLKKLYIMVLRFEQGAQKKVFL